MVIARRVGRGFDRVRWIRIDPYYSWLADPKVAGPCNTQGRSGVVKLYNLISSPKHGHLQVLFLIVPRSDHPTISF